MAESMDFNNLLEEIKERMPELYQEMAAHAQRTGKSLEELSKDQAFIEGYISRYRESKEAEVALDDAVDVEINAADNDEEVALEGEENADSADSTAAAAAAAEEEIVDPYHWEEFYAPAPEAEVARFNSAYGLLNDEDGKAFRESPAWQRNNIGLDRSSDQSLEEALNLSACRRLASSNEDVTLQNLNDARAAEGVRIKVEYYNSLYAQAIGDKYNTIKAETHLNRIFKIDEAVRSGKSEKEIFKMLAINPNESAQKMAQTTVTHANMQPINNFLQKRSKFSRGMHNFGKVMDRIQKFEQKNPLFGVGLNFVAAGNPVYMGYRSVLSARALYNDFQGFKDYAAFREVYKNDVAELGLQRWKEQNPESKIENNDYNQVNAYDTYEAYCEKHKVEANRVSEEEFLQLKKFQKKAVFTREEFETLRQSAGMPYEEYAKRAGERAVSEKMFNNLIKYVDIRRTQNYEEYAKNVGANAVSNEEYNQIKALNRALGKISIGQVIKDKTTRKAMMAHSVIFVRSLPVVGQGYALIMAAQNMARKSYWQGLKAKAQGTGSAVKTLWSKKGRDKEAWKELWSNGNGLVAEAAGAWMLAGGIGNMTTHAVMGAETAHVSAEQTETNLGNEQNLNNVQAAAPVAESPSLWERFQGFMGYGNQEAPAQTAAENTEPTPATREDTLSEQTRENTLQAAINDHDLQQARQSFANAADSTEMQAPHAPEEQATHQAPEEQATHQAPEERGNAEQDSVGATALDMPTTAVELNDMQKANLNALFEQYPRAASIILEGNDNPSVNDVTKGTFALEGEGDLYKSGVISSAQLKEMMTEGKLSSAQLESLSQFADAHFENGKMNAELAEQLYGSAAESQADEASQSAVSNEDVKAEEAQTTTPETPKNEQSAAEENNDVGQETQSEIRFYSFDQDGNIIYHADALKDIAGMDPEQVDAQAYQDLQNRQSNGEQLDAGALKFIASYEEAHPDMQQTEENVNEAKVAESVLNAQEPAEQLNGIALTRHDFENGNGYSMSGSGELNNKEVSVLFGYDENDTQVMAQYEIKESESHSTVIKIQLDDEGRPHTLVTETNGDKTTTREVDDAQVVLRQALSAEVAPSGQATEGLEESRHLLNENETEEKAEVVTQTDKVRSSTFHGKYWLEADANGENPQLRCRMGDPSQIAADRELVAAFQNTIDGSGNSYTALGGLLTSDNFGAENRDNPSASGIMIKCENLAKTIALNEAVYQDMQHRLENGEQLSELDMKWRQNYESDLEKIGLGRENGHLVYETQTVSAQVTNQQQEAPTADRQQDTKEGQAGSRVYDMQEQRDNQVADNVQTTGEEVNRFYKIVETEQGYRMTYSGPALKAEPPITTDMLTGGQLYRNTETGVYSYEKGGFASSDMQNVINMANRATQDINRDVAINQDMERRVAAGETLSKAEQQWCEDHKHRVTWYGLNYNEAGQLVDADKNVVWQPAPEQESHQSGERVENAPADNSQSSSQTSDYTQLESKGVKMAYSLTADGEVKYANNAKVSVDQNMLQAIRSQYDNSGLTPQETRETLAVARDLTKGEAVYGHLQQESANRELSAAEHNFMNKHNQALEQAGLARDKDGEIVHKNAYENQPRAAAKRGRDYGD